MNLRALFIVEVLVIMTSSFSLVLANGEGVSPLIKHIINGQVAEVTLYLEGDNSPDVLDEQGNPALIIATAHKQIPIVKLLLEAQANPNLTDTTGMTALMIATDNQDHDIIPLLLEHGANVNLQNKRTGYTALMYAITHHDSTATELLLQYQADVNIQNYNNETALTIAQTLGYTDIFQTLLFSDWNPVTTAKTPAPKTTVIATTPSSGTPTTIPADTSPSSATKISAEVTEYINKSDYLLTQDHIRLAREVLKEGYQTTGQFILLKKWFAIDERLFNQLNLHNQQSTLTQRMPASSFQQSWNFLANRQRQIQYEMNHPIATVPFSKVDPVLEGYEQLKLSLLELEKLLSNQIRNASSHNLQQVEELVRQHKNMVKQVQQSRSNYISFDVLSPYLARAEQQLFLAENAYYLSISYSPEQLHQAIKTLAQVAHQNLIFSAKIPVQEQFFQVYRLLQATTQGQIQFEELTIVYQIANKLRNRGFTIEKWWPSSS